MNLISVKFRRLVHGSDLELPSYASMGAAGMDLAAALNQPACIQPGSRLAVPTGFAMALPEGYEAQVRPRSGLALKHGVTIANAPGTIDSDYRGEITVILLNAGTDDFIITRGMRIAQMVIATVTIITPIEANDLDDTKRGADGFGSTGL
ncbi:dUTP diphosphatase [Candidatus Puniceispirillum sp.]|nr:dUTP diphosphatase [Candidatus Puniceispirillum sp.]